jgi:hypothetical protein
VNWIRQGIEGISCEYRWAGLFKSLKQSNANAIDKIKGFFSADNYDFGGMRLAA